MISYLFVEMLVNKVREEWVECISEVENIGNKMSPSGSISAFQRLMWHDSPTPSIMGFLGAISRCFYPKFDVILLFLSLYPTRQFFGRDSCRIMCPKHASFFGLILLRSYLFTFSQ